MERLFSSLIIDASQRGLHILCPIHSLTKFIIQIQQCPPSNKSKFRSSSVHISSVCELRSKCKFKSTSSSLPRSSSILTNPKPTSVLSCYENTPSSDIISKTIAIDLKCDKRRSTSKCSSSTSLYHTSQISSSNHMKNHSRSRLIVEGDTVTFDSGIQQYLSDLKSRIIFQNGHLLALNKPFGLSVYGQNADDTSLKEKLPELAQDLDCPALGIGISLKSYYSGVTVLTKNETSAKELCQFLQHADAQKQCCISFLAITVGVPQCQTNEDVELVIQRDFLHGREMSLVSEEKLSKSAQKYLRNQGNLIKVTYNVQVLAENPETHSALVRLNVNKFKWEACEVFLSHFLSPVLGDNIYSGRTHFVMGVPFPSPPKAAAPGFQRLPREIIKALGHQESDGNVKSLPLFLHLHKVNFQRFPKSSSANFDVTAPLSETFQHCLKLLGLHHKLDNDFS